MSFRNTLIIAALILLGAFLYFRSLRGGVGNTQPVSPTPSETIQKASPQASSDLTPTSEAQPKNVVTITASGFSPQSITIKAGESVTWTNFDSSGHQINSNPHPSHTNYPPLNTVGLIKPGESKTLTFPDKGTFGYHDHLNPQVTGTAVVE